MRPLHLNRASTLTMALCALVAAAGCHDSTAPAIPPAQITSASSTLTVVGVLAAVTTLQPSIKAVDAAGNPVQGVPIHVAITGGGSVQNSHPTTNAAGIATTGAWTLGPDPGTQTVSMSASGLEPVVFTATVRGTFIVDVRFIGPTPSAAVQAAFAAAALRVEQVVTRALTPVNVTDLNAATACNDPTLPTLNEVIPNLVIFAEIIPIDGVGKVLGQSGPCASRSDTHLPVLGIMQFDVADMDAMAANGTINTVVLHEMQHVLGFGTLWDGPPYFPTVLVRDTSTANPIYVGPAARAAFVAAGGTSPSGVPVEGGSIAGTSNSHWRKSVFQSELMTGYVESFAEPFSRISMAALADLGYTVSYATADPFSVPSPGAIRLNILADSVATAGERLIHPRFEVDAAGRMTPIARGPMVPKQ